ncbi:conserved hypothetical protein [Nostocoides japonicum T1-X7]|uniref:Uncharacterized protein n=1 Tax=Nostocoides japonicum T1-X7 TaxID=1194083 RepID=A0A077M7X7_9MICO|nr:hypothetical protein [Tetrasphaera japonica]CCH80150.1 conserved hypothetical protein [Tetrasphaera japonica T1-X7]
MRLLLVGDVLRRIVEVTSGDRIAVDVGPGRCALTRPLGRLLDGLQLGEPHRPSGLGEAASTSSSGRPRVVLVPADTSNDITNRLVLRVASVSPPGLDDALTRQLDERDPLTLRLALLRTSYAVPAVLSAARLRRAEETLDRWRFKVAYWKDQPTAPPQGIEDMRDALARDLDTATVLRMLHRLELDHGIPSGAKFATFVDLDRVLALDLRRRCGLGHW